MEIFFSSELEVPSFVLLSLQFNNKACEVVPGQLTYLNGRHGAFCSQLDEIQCNSMEKISGKMKIRRFKESS